VCLLVHQRRVVVAVRRKLLLLLLDMMRGAHAKGLRVAASQMLHATRSRVDLLLLRRRVLELLVVVVLLHLMQRWRRRLWALLPARRLHHEREVGHVVREHGGTQADQAAAGVSIFTAAPRLVTRQAPTRPTARATCSGA
jgi:hypothetical protein